MRRALLPGLLLAGRVAHGEESVEQVTLDEALRRARQQAASLAIAHADLLRAEALVSQARAGVLPQLTANATLTRLDGDRTIGERVLVPATGAGANLQLSVPLLAGPRWTALRRARDGAEAATAQVAAEERAVSAVVARTALAVVSQHRVLELARSAEETAREHVAHAKARFEAGTGNRIDLLRATQEEASATSQRIAAETALVRVEEALGLATGTPHPLDLTAPPSFEGQTSGLERADLAAARRREANATRAMDDAWGDYVPALTLVAQPFLQNPATPTQPAQGWQAQLVLTLPLWEGGVRTGQQKDRLAQHAQAKAQLEQLERQAASELRVALATMRRSDEALEAARTSAAAAREIRDVTLKAFETGTAASLEVVDAQQRSRQADLALALAEDAARQARLELLLAKGALP
jgi:multidrug efflux system outer membrane protein